MRPQRNTSRRPSTTERRTLDSRQMRYQVLGRTTDESDLIVQISPAFYEYVRSMAHQGVKAPKVDADNPRYGKFAHPFHRDPLYSKDRGEGERRGGKFEQTIAPKKKAKGEWYEDDIDMGDIDTEMDEEYQMIKQGFANLDKKNSNKGGVRSRSNSESRGRSRR